jgi:hypothetical protein
MCVLIAACDGFTADVPLDAGPLAPDRCDADEAALGYCQPYDQDHFSFTVATDLCGFLFECCSGDELVNRRLVMEQLAGVEGLQLLLLQEPELFTDVDACARANNQLVLAKHQEALLSQLAGRRQPLSSTLAASCFADVRDARSLCAPALLLLPNLEPDACQQMFAPLQPLDAPCTSDDDCIDDEGPVHCVNNSGPVDINDAEAGVVVVLEGRCALVPGPGDRCSYSSPRCEDDAVCALALPTDDEVWTGDELICRVPADDYGRCTNPGGRCPDEPSSADHEQGICLLEGEQLLCRPLCVADVCGPGTACVTTADVRVCLPSLIPDHGQLDEQPCVRDEQCDSHSCDPLLRVCVRINEQDIAFPFCLNADDPRPRHRDARP